MRCKALFNGERVGKLPVYTRGYSIAQIVKVQCVSCPPLPLGEGWGSEGLAVDYVLHQAALGSVPRSLEDPITPRMALILMAF